MEPGWGKHHAITPAAGSGKRPAWLRKSVWDREAEEALSGFTGVRCLWRLVLRDGESGQERRLKLLMTPAVAFYLLPVSYYVVQGAVTGSAAEGGLWIPALLLAMGSSALFLLFVVLSRRLPMLAVEIFLLAQMLVCPAADWASASRGHEEMWPWGLLVLEIMLVVECRPWVHHLGCVVLVLWVAMRSVEDCGSVGLWGLVEKSQAWGRYDWGDLARVLVARLVPVLLTYFFTRSFASGLRGEQRRVDRTISAAEGIASDLQNYDVQSAARRVQAAGDSMPTKLLQALRGLLTNLEMYRPYIPQSCLPKQYCDDTPEDSELHPGIGLGTPDFFAMPEPAQGEPPAAVQGPRGAAPTAAPPEDRPRRVSAGQAHRRTSASLRRNFSSPISSSHTLLTTLDSRSPVTSPAVPMVPSMLSRDQSQESVVHSTMTDVIQCASEATVSRVQSVRSQASVISPQSPTSFSARQWLRSGQQPSFSHELKRKSASVVVANIRAYLRFARMMSSGRLGQLHRDVLTQIVAAATAAKGITDHISADRVYASVNCSRPAGRHMQRAVQLAWAFSEVDTALSHTPPCRLATVPEIPGASHRERAVASAASPLPEHAGPSAGDVDQVMLSISCGVCAGDLLCGDIGCDAVRRYATIGPSATWAHALERLATRQKLAVLTNGLVKDDSELGWSFRLRDYVAMAKPSHSSLKGQLLWEVMGPREQQVAEEWMYQLDAIRARDPWNLYNRAREQFYKGDYNAALQMVQNGRAESEESFVGDGSLWDELEQQIAQHPADSMGLFEEGCVTRGRRGRAGPDRPWAPRGPTLSQRDQMRSPMQSPAVDKNDPIFSQQTPRQTSGAATAVARDKKRSTDSQSSLHSPVLSSPNGSSIFPAT